jgi:hypothetical protein
MIRAAFKLLLFAGALATGGVIAASIFKEPVEGSGTPATEDREVGEVTEVRLVGGGNLIIKPGEIPGLTVTADDNILPLIETETAGRKLTLTLRDGYNIRTKTPITYTLTVSRLSKLSVSGSGHARVDHLKGDNLTVRVSGSGQALLNGVEYSALTVNLSGSGHVTVSGTTDTLSIRTSGSGEIDAGALKAQTGDVQVSGSGNVTVWATDRLKLRMSGSGTVSYKGRPQIERKVTGSGRINAITP